MKLFLSLFLFCILAGEGFARAEGVVIGSKKFTESVVLAEVIHLLLESKNVSGKHIAELGGTRILWNALLAGNIDIYPEYSSTIEDELLKTKFKSFAELKEKLAEQGIGITAPLGFNNTYAIGIKKARALSLGLSKISDLARYPDFKMGLSEEFLQRRDGWPALKQTYKLPQSNLRGIDHDVAYRAMQSGDIDIIDLYSTDAEIQYYDLLVLEDDLKYFPRYEAVYLYRLEAAQREPNVLLALKQLEGKISESTMIEMNRKAKIDKQASRDVAAAFLKEKFSVEIKSADEGLWHRIWLHTQEHLKLVLISLFLAILVAIPLGIVAEKNNKIGQVILTLTGVIQTIPSLALLVILIKPLNLLGLTGIGDTPALVALFLYSLLPIVRGTHAGLQQIPLSLRETSEVLGISFWSRLFRIDIPLALPTILSGIKTAAVMNVGFATLGALVGAGGYGQPILTGIRLDDYSLILEGAIPSAVLALGVQLFFDGIERFFVSPGLRK